MKKAILTLFILCLSWLVCPAQTGRIRILEYNIENMFDTLHCEGKQDETFTPQGECHWNSIKYWSKLNKIGRIIASASGKSAADIVGLIEIENDSVVYDLTQRTKLRRMGYDYIITHSEDVRGINVALLYQRAKFNPLLIEDIRVAPPDIKELHPTRDILHVMGEAFTGDTLHIFLCHFPSKKGGRAADIYRDKVAMNVKHKADSVANTKPNAKIIIMGDFNAYYPEKIFSKTLRTRIIEEADSIDTKALYLLTNRMDAHNGIKGTYKFRGQWNLLDNFIVSGSLLQKKNDGSLYTNKKMCKIVDLPILLQKDKKGDGVHPYRTLLGHYYQGGFSDHLPILLDLEYVYK